MMMNFNMLRALALSTSALAALSATSAWAERVTVVNGYPPVFLWTKHLSETFIPAVDAALEGSGHKIEWTESYGGSLVNPGGELEAIEDGIAQVGIVMTFLQPTALPLQNVTYNTPFSSPDVKIVLDAMNRLHEDVPEMIKSWEDRNAVYLGAGVSIDDYFLMTTFPVSSVDDLKNKRIGAPGPAVNWLEGTGAVGVAGNLTTYYNDISTGVYQGAILFPTAAGPSRLQEVAPHVTVTHFGATYAGTLVANKEWFDDQPEEIQNAFRAGAKAFADAYIGEQLQRISASNKALEEGGAKFATLSPEERSRWAHMLPPLGKNWAKDADARGLPGTRTLEHYMAILKEAGVELPRDWSQE